MKTKPNDLVNVGSGDIEDGGLTKREYFAAKALHGMLSDGDEPDSKTASNSVNVADLLIKALNKPKTETK